MADGVLHKRFFANVIQTTGCWQWIGSTYKNGYGRIWVDGKSMRAHRLSYELFCGELKTGMDVCHRCDNPPCVNPEHLWIGTRKDNMADCIRKERFKSKLTKEKVREIRNLYKTGDYSHKDLANMFGVSTFPICSVINNKSWILV